MKKTPFFEKHLALNAKMVDFAGYEMPVYYTSINEEHLCVRNNVGVFDISHMGEFMVKGAQALSLLQYMTTNDVEKIENNQAQYSMFTNKEGNIVDDILIYCIEKNKTYMLVVNASNIEKNWLWINEQNKAFGADLENISDDCALLAVQGPKATKLIQEIAGDFWDILEMRHYHFKKGTFLGIDDVLISATGYTGSGGVEIYIKNKHNNPQKIWDTLFDMGKAYHLQPIGLGARDTLRLEMGYCLYGNDIDQTTNPIEANLGWATKFSKNFVGKEALETIKQHGIQRKRIGFILQQKAIPRTHCLIKDGKNNTLGMVTSGTFSPSLQLGIGMAYIDVAHSKIGSSFFIEIRDKKIPATIVNLPFLKTNI